jgi:hypothetical protein
MTCDPSHEWDATWAAELQLSLNASAKVRAKMKGAGYVTFVSLDSKQSQTTLILHWDKIGNARLETNESSRLPTQPVFSATHEEWANFFAGGASAMTTVLSKRIVYSGPLWFAMKYSSGFDCIVRECFCN